MTKKVLLHLILNILTYEMWWCHWWYHQYHLTLTLVPMVLHEQKVILDLIFSHLDLNNVMVLLSASTDTNANGITWPKSHVASRLDHLDLWNVMVPLMTLLALHDANISNNSVPWINIILHLISIVLTYEMQWNHIWCCCNVMLNPVVSHDQKRCCISIQLSFT